MAPCEREQIDVSLLLSVEADVNVLVVGSSTARRGAIGRHFTFPHIRRRRKPVFEALLYFLRADWARVAGERPTELSSRKRNGKKGCVCLSENRGQPSLSLY